MTPEPDVESFQRLYSAYVDPSSATRCAGSARRPTPPTWWPRRSWSRGAGALRCRPARPSGCGCTAWPARARRPAPGGAAPLRAGRPAPAELPAAVPDPAGGRWPAGPTWSARWPSSARADREAVELTAWEGLDSREVAEVLGITPMAARPRLSRARSGCGVLGHDPVPTGHEEDQDHPDRPAGGAMTTQRPPRSPTTRWPSCRSARRGPTCSANCWPRPARPRDRYAGGVAGRLGSPGPDGGRRCRPLGLSQARGRQRDRRHPGTAARHRARRPGPRRSRCGWSG